MFFKYFRNNKLRYVIDSEVTQRTLTAIYSIVGTKSRYSLKIIQCQAMLLQELHPQRAPKSP